MATGSEAPRWWRGPGAARPPIIRHAPAPDPLSAPYVAEPCMNLTTPLSHTALEGTPHAELPARPGPRGEPRARRNHRVGLLGRRRGRRAHVPANTFGGCRSALQSILDPLHRAGRGLSLERSGASASWACRCSEGAAWHGARGPPDVVGFQRTGAGPRLFHHRGRVRDAAGGQLAAWSLPPPCAGAHPGRSGLGYPACPTLPPGWGGRGHLHSAGLETACRVQGTGWRRYVLPIQGDAARAGPSSTLFMHGNVPSF